MPSLVSLLENLDDAAGANGAATLTDSETQTLIHSDRLTQLDRHHRVIARHDHLRPLRQRDRTRHIRRPEVELRPIIVEERLMAAPLLLGQQKPLRPQIAVRLAPPPLPPPLTPTPPPPPPPPP